MDWGPIKGKDWRERKQLQSGEYRDIFEGERTLLEAGKDMWISPGSCNIESITLFDGNNPSNKNYQAGGAGTPPTVNYEIKGEGGESYGHNVPNIGINQYNYKYIIEPK